MLSTRVESPVGAVAGGLFAFLIVLGATQPWEKALFVVSKNGTETTAGLVVLVAGLCGIALSFGRALQRVPDPLNYAGGLICGSASLVAGAWYLIDLSQRDDFKFFGSEIQIVDPGVGVYLSLAGAVGFLMVLAWEVGIKMGRAGVDRAAG